jgi:magnesium-transporting ATPase (P-type)
MAGEEIYIILGPIIFLFLILLIQCIGTLYVTLDSDSDDVKKNKESRRNMCSTGSFWSFILIIVLFIIAGINYLYEEYNGIPHGTSPSSPTTPTTTNTSSTL